MAHLLRNIVALAGFAGFAAVNGCTAQAGPEGSDPQQQGADTKVGEAQEEARPDPAFDYCNLDGAASNTPGTCGYTICTQLGDSACCKSSWGGNCVREALSFCRTPTFGGPVSCQCPHSVCTTGAPLDYGCPGSATFFKQCPALVCDQMPSCCKTGWTSTCVGLASRLCGANCR